MKELKAGDLIWWRGRRGLVFNVEELRMGHRAFDALFDDGATKWIPDWQWRDLEVMSST